jgi:hypothetical protein
LKTEFSKNEIMKISAGVWAPESEEGLKMIRGLDNKVFTANLESKA